MSNRKSATVNELNRVLSYLDKFYFANKRKLIVDCIMPYNLMNSALTFLLHHNFITKFQKGTGTYYCLTKYKDKINTCYFNHILETSDHQEE